MAGAEADGAVIAAPLKPILLSSRSWVKRMCFGVLEGHWCMVLMAVEHDGTMIWSRFGEMEYHVCLLQEIVHVGVLRIWLYRYVWMMNHGI